MCEVTHVLPIDFVYPKTPELPSATLLAPNSDAIMPCDELSISLQDLKGTGRRNLTVLKWDFIDGFDSSDSNLKITYTE